MWKIEDTKNPIFYIALGHPLNKLAYGAVDIVPSSCMDVSENWGYLQIIQNSWVFPLFSPSNLGFPPLFLGNTHIFIDSFMVQFPNGYRITHRSIAPTYLEDHPILASG